MQHELESFLLKKLRKSVCFNFSFNSSSNIAVILLRFLWISPSCVLKIIYSHKISNAFRRSLVFGYVCSYKTSSLQQSYFSVPSFLSKRDSMISASVTRFSVATKLSSADSRYLAVFSSGKNSGARRASPSICSWCSLKALYCFLAVLRLVASVKCLLFQSSWQRFRL